MNVQNHRDRNSTSYQIQKQLIRQRRKMLKLKVVPQFISVTTLEVKTTGSVANANIALRVISVHTSSIACLQTHSQISDNFKSEKGSVTIQLLESLSDLHTRLC